MGYGRCLPISGCASRLLHGAQLAGVAGGCQALEVNVAAHQRGGVAEPELGESVGSKHQMVYTDLS
jgi:hypothetical protein